MKPVPIAEWFFSPSASQIVEQLGWVLIHSVWQFAFVAMVAQLVVHFLSNRSAAIRYRVLLLSIGLCVVAPFATWFRLPANENNLLSARRDFASRRDLSEQNATVTNEALSAERRTLPDQGTANAQMKEIVPGTRSSELPSTAPNLTANIVALPGRITAALRPWLAWIVVGWIVGVLLCSLRPLLGWRMLHRLRRVGLSDASEEARSAARQISHRLGLGRVVEVFQSTLVRAPVTLGYFLPMILLPVSLLTSIPASQLESLLAHELAHVRRNDFLTNLLQTLVETLFFYHPAVWWLSHQVRIEREHCCDDLVVSSLGNRIDYGRALLAVAEQQGLNALLAMGATDGSVLSRVKRILGVNAARSADPIIDRGPVALFGLISLGMAIVLSTGWKLTATDDTAKPASREQVKPERYLAELPNGLQVEFAGITKNTASARKGWRPDGLKPNDLREWPEGSSMYNGNTIGRGKPENAILDENGYDFLFEFQGLHIQPSLIFELPADGAGFSHDPLHEPYRLRVSGHFRDLSTTLDPPADEVRVGLTDEPWGSWQKISATGELLNQLGDRDRYRSYYSQVALQRVIPKNDDQQSITLVLRQPKEHGRQYAFEIRGVDTEGQDHWISQRQSYSVDRADLEESKWGLTLPLPQGKQFSHFEYRLRPYRHWVTFKGISLTPNDETEVTVSVSQVDQDADDANETEDVNAKVQLQIDPEQKNAGKKNRVEREVIAPTVIGTVVAIDDSPVAGIKILAFECGKQLDQEFVTDDRGQFRVPKAWRSSDHYLTLVARDGNDRLGWFDFFFHGHSDDGQKSDDGSFRIVLLPMNRTVRGRLMDEAGNPLANIKIEVQYLQHDVNFASAHWRYQTLEDKPLIHGAITDQDGKFELKLPPDVSGWLGAEHPDWVARRIQVPKDATNLADTKLPQAGKIAGRVLESGTGKPMAAVTVAAQATVPDMDTGGWGEAKTDEQGNYVIGGLPAGFFDVMLLKTSFKTLTAVADRVKVKPGETQQHFFWLIVGSRLAGRVVDAETNLPIAGCTVNCSGPSRPGGAVLSTVTDRRGEFEFFVPPGKNQVYIGEVREHVPEQSADVDVSADQDPKPVALKAGRKLDGPGFKIFVGPPLERRVSAHFDTLPLADALQRICQSAGVRLQLGAKIESIEEPISIDLDGIKLRSALKLILQRYDNLSFEIDGDLIVVAERKEITGLTQLPQLSP